MKKSLVVVSLLLVGGAVAVAGTINVPFYLDNGSQTSSTGIPPTGNATWICLKNPSPSSAMEATIRYFDNDGTERTPSTNTFTLNAGAALSWRPVATDTNEGSGAAVPNKDGGKSAGTAIITYAGTDLVTGRVLSTSTSVSYGYTIFSD